MRQLIIIALSVLTIALIIYLIYYYKKRADMKKEL